MGNLYVCFAEGLPFDSLFGWLRVTYNSGCNTHMQGLLRCFRDPIRVPRIREIGSLQVHTWYPVVVLAI